MIKTDILIIGAGPVGMFAVFEAGLLKLRCHLIDALAEPGGQCTEIYPKKPIYDIPAYPEILAGDLVKNLATQIAPFQPSYTLGERADTIEKLADGSFKVTTNKGTEHNAPLSAHLPQIQGKPFMGNMESKENTENIQKLENRKTGEIWKAWKTYKTTKTLKTIIFVRLREPCAHKPLYT